MAIRAPEKKQRQHKQAEKNEGGSDYSEQNHHRSGG